MIDESNYNDSLYDLFGQINLDPESQKASKIHPSLWIYKEETV